MCNVGVSWNGVLAIWTFWMVAFHLLFDFNSWWCSPSSTCMLGILVRDWRLLALACSTRYSYDIPEHTDLYTPALVVWMNTRPSLCGARVLCRCLGLRFSYQSCQIYKRWFRMFYHRFHAKTTFVIRCKPWAPTNLDLVSNPKYYWYTLRCCMFVFNYHS